MSKFIQDGTGVVISVADEKDARFATGYQPFEEPKKPARKSASKSDGE